MTTKALGYVRVSTDQQGESGAGLDAQRATIQAEVDRRGWVLETMHSDVGSGKSTRGRPELARALHVLGDGQADALIIAKLDRLSRSLIDFAELMVRADREGWSIVALDIGVDTTTINGELIANIIMSLAQWERKIIGQRTRDALAVVRARGTQLGRPITTTPDAEAVIRLLRRQGFSFHTVAKMLNDDGVPTAQGGVRWYPSSVRAVCRRLGL